MPPFAVKFILSRKLAQAIKSKDTIGKPLADGIQRTVLFFEGTVKKHTPVDTGRLRSSIAHTINPSVAKVGTNVQYAQFVEYGTKHMAARHVPEASNQRILGKGPFTKSLEILESWLSQANHKIHTEIEKMFGD